MRTSRALLAIGALIALLIAINHLSGLGCVDETTGADRCANADR